MGKPKKYEERLMEALAFDEDDLAANQTGHFSEAQRKRLAGEQRQFGAVAVFFTLLFLGWIVLMPISSAASVTLPVLLVLLPIFGALFLTYAIRAYRLRSDVNEDQVMSTEGRVDLSMRGRSSNNVECTIRVGDMRFRVKQQVFLAMKNGDPYRLYFSRRSKRLLSAEWLRENDDNLLEMPDATASGEPERMEADAEISEMKRQRS